MSRIRWVDSQGYVTDTSGALYVTDTSASPATTITSGTKTVASPGTAEPLVATSTACKKIILTPRPTNTDVVYWGGSNVSAVSGSEVGMPIAGLGAMATIEIDDVAKIYIDSVVAGEGVIYNYLN